MKEPFILNKLPFVWRFSPWERRLCQFCFRLRFRPPIYDLSRHFINREAKRLYRIDSSRMAPKSVEQRVIRELRDNGLSVVHLTDLFPLQLLNELQSRAEKLVADPAVRDRIKAIENGAHPDAKSDKFFLVRLWGDLPSVDIRDKFVKTSLSDAMLRIVCGYLGMFSRLTAVELWCNVPTPGPAILSQRWHRDPEDRKLVKTFLYLRDVDENHGPFSYIPGTHNGGPFRNFHPQDVQGNNYPDDGVVEAKFSPAQRRLCTGKAGTLIFCDTTGFHRGGQPTAGARLLFNAVYTTNASIPVITRQKYFSLTSSRAEALSSPADYAIGHVRDA